MITMPKKKKIFLIEDQPIVRHGLTQLINRESTLTVCGYAENVEEALSSIAKIKPDLVIVDTSLQSHSDLNLINHVRERFGETLVVVFSMHEESSYAERALRSGAKGYVTKREPCEQIITAINNVLNGGFYISGGMAMGLVEKLVNGGEKNYKEFDELITDREMEVFQLLGQGKKTIEIAKLLNIGLKTVQTNCARIKGKLHLPNSTALMREAVCWYESQKTPD